MTKLLEGMRWREVPIGVTAAFGTSNLLLGEIGGGQPGVLITAGLHGDEGPWGAWAIHKLLSGIDEKDLRGFLRVVPMANPLAMQADKRNAPVDQLDLNRLFPGDEGGSYSERVAHILATAALEGVDAVIDLHGGGSWCVNAFVFEMSGGQALSRCFPAPFIVKAPARAVSLTGYAQTRGLTVTAVEMGGRGPDERRWAGKIAQGLLRALCALGLVDAALAPAPAEAPIAVGGTTALRPAQGGIFQPTLAAGHVGSIVRRGALLGCLRHPATFATLEEFRAPFDETALLLLRPFMAQVEAGAMTYVVAQPVRPERKEN